MFLTSSTRFWSIWYPGNLNSILSVAGRAHALSGLAVTAGQLGIVTNTKPDGVGHKKILLGPASKEYFL